MHALEADFPLPGGQTWGYKIVIGGLGVYDGTP